MRILVLLFLLAGVLLQAAGPVVIKAIPSPLEWKNAPASWKAGDRELTIAAPRMTDWYISPLDGETHSNAPLLLFKPAPDFVLSAKVAVQFSKQWDAGALWVYNDDKAWVKFAFENSTALKPNIVSVVTRGFSDDCNSDPITANSVWLKIARTGETVGLYYSLDGKGWRLVRVFNFGPAPALRIGFSAQSPAGEGSTTTFSDIAYRPGKIKDIFSGN